MNKTSFKLIVYCCLCVAVGCSKKGDQAAMQPPPPIPVLLIPVTACGLTYNIHHANPSEGTVIDTDSIAKIIKKQQPDLVALQEVDVNNTRSGITLNEASDIANKSGLAYYYFGKAIKELGQNNFYDIGFIV